MFRPLLALAASGVFVVAAGAADLPTTTHAVQFVVATVKDDKLTYETAQPYTFTEYVDVTRQVNGQTVTEKVPVTKTAERKVTHARPLSELKATGADGKEIPAADLKEKLKAGGPVVLATAPVTDEWRKLFKPDTLFLEPKK